MRSDAERMYLHMADEALFWPSPEAPAGAFASVVPAGALSGFVQRIHFGHEWVDPARPVVERVLPDGGVHLIFNLGDPPSVPGESQAACIAVGARCAPSIIRMAGLVEHVTATLRPGGMAALLGGPAGELAAHDVPLEVLWGSRADEVRERMAAAPRGHARAAILESALLTMLASREVRLDEAAAEGVRLIERAGGRIRVRELATALGIGERRLEQVFHRHVGLAPKAVCRLARFRATVALMQRQPHRAWTDVAFHCGFYDQSHLVNEFQALAGLAPGEFRERGCGFLQDEAAGRQ